MRPIAAVGTAFRVAVLIQIETVTLMMLGLLGVLVIGVRLTIAIGAGRVTIFQEDKDTPFELFYFARWISIRSQVVTI